MLYARNEVIALWMDRAQVDREMVSSWVQDIFSNLSATAAWSVALSFRL